MEKPIVTALFIIASMILVTLLFNMAYPAVVQGGEAITSMASNQADHMRTQISIVHASPNFDGNGLCQNATCNVYAWLKNTGMARIIGLNQIDVFFGPEGNFTRIPSESEAEGGFPYWTEHVDDGTPLGSDTDWVPSATLQITIHYQAPPARGRYFLKVTAPNGVSSEYFLGL